MDRSPSREAHGLVEILDRILDKGLVIAGDVRISLANVELLTIQIRLLICSIDKAEQIGLDWWRHDPAFAGRSRATLASEKAQLDKLRTRVTELEAKLAGGKRLPAASRAKRRR